MKTTLFINIQRMQMFWKSADDGTFYRAEVKRVAQEHCPSSIYSDTNFAFCENFPTVHLTFKPASFPA